MNKVLIAAVVALTFGLGAPVMAQTSSADAAAAQAQIDALKQQLQQMQATLDGMKGNVTPVAKEPTKAIVEVDNGSTTVGGQAFMDFGNISNQQNGVDITPTGTGFDIKRFYLIVDHKFDEVWAANLTTDAQYLADRTTTRGLLGRPAPQDHHGDHRCGDRRGVGSVHQEALPAGDPQ